MNVCYGDRLQELFYICHICASHRHVGFNIRDVNNLVLLTSDWEFKRKCIYNLQEVKFYVGEECRSSSIGRAADL